MNYSIKHCNWHRHAPSLQAIRTTVFVEEQRVSVARDNDGLDASAQHWLALDAKGLPVGTIRMLSNGHIGRMAVLAQLRGQGVGAALLAAVVNYARQQSLFDVYLHAQTHALTFYRNAGFEAYGEEFLDADISHKAMRLQLAPQRLLGLHGGQFSVDNFSATLAELIAQTSNQLRLYSVNLDQRLFDDAQVLQSISALARKHRNSSLQILVADSADIVNRGHGLLELQRRLPSKIAIKKLHPEALLPKHDTIVADACAYLCRGHSESASSWANYYDVSGAKNAIEQFDMLWQRALIDRDLQLLSW